MKAYHLEVVLEEGGGSVAHTHLADEVPTRSSNQAVPPITGLLSSSVEGAAVSVGTLKGMKDMRQVGECLALILSPWLLLFIPPSLNPQPPIPQPPFSVQVLAVRRLSMQSSHEKLS